MAHKKEEKTEIPAFVWFLGLVVIFGLGAILTHVIPEDTVSIPEVAASTEQQSTPTVASDPALVGLWQSIDDKKFSREFKADLRAEASAQAGGTVEDRYLGNDTATQIGTWVVVDPTQENTGVSPTDLAGMTVLKLAFPDGQVMYYGVSAVSSDSLTLIYLVRGNTLSFTKVP